MDELLAKIKRKLKISDTNSDLLLTDYIGDCSQEILNRFNNPSMLIVPTRYNGNIVNAVVELYSKSGAEGEIAHNENGVNRTYVTTEYPKILYSNIVPFVGSPIKVITI